MIFPYQKVLRVGEPRYEPLIDVRVVSESKVQMVRALVDSGADRNVLGMDIGKHPQINFRDARRVAIIGVGEQVSDGLLAWVDFGLASRRWRAETIFSEAANQRAVLGQEGFFDVFNVDFRRSQREIDIRWVGR